MSQKMLTHGFVHGHIHQHEDHVHIHGHIHNHDHKDTSETQCEEMTSYDICNDVICDDLDDCFFDHCDSVTENTPFPRFSEHLEDIDHSNGECCDDPACLEDATRLICDDPTCTEVARHDTSLCESQRPRKMMFENLIQNISKNVDQNGEVYNTHAELLSIHIHFPHLCHSEVETVENKEVVFPNEVPPHSKHQLCFHAKIPGQNINFLTVSDLNFLALFDNFSRMLEENKLPPEDSVGLYPCQWEKCAEHVNDRSLVSHLIESHLKDGPGDFAAPRFECEWHDCDFANTDYNNFLSHLSTHKESKALPKTELFSPVLTPNSLTSISSAHSENQLEKLNVSNIRIFPKISEPDPTFTCKWQTGVDGEGKPIVCGLKHRDEGHLQQHLQDDHIGAGKKEYQCCWEGCCRNNGKPFVQRQKLFRHIHVHTRYKPCKCEICGACFTVAAVLEQHIRTHSGEKPFECNICNKRFSTSSSLAVHRRVHSGDRPLMCKWPGCGKRFSESSNLNKHMRLHGRVFRCETCGLEFDKKSALTKHERAHRITALVQAAVGV